MLHNKCFFYFAVDQVFGSDIEPAIENAVEKIMSSGFREEIEEIMSSGFEPIREEVEEKVKEVIGSDEDKVI